MKRTIRDNYRVVVTPECPWMAPSVECAAIRGQIIRHADVSARSVRVEWDTYDVCGFCSLRHPEWRWDVDEHGCPMCCAEARAEWEKARVSALALLAPAAEGG